MGRGDENSDTGPRALGTDPKTGLAVSLKSGRFGPYVQLGEQENGGEKPARAGIPKGFSPETIDLAMALKLLSLPREIGQHPETGKPIVAGYGRFGPYVSSDGAYASLDSPEEVFTVGLNRAVVALAERKMKGGRGPRGGQALKELGPHPETALPIKVMKGRYGPYVTDGKINATLPRDSDPEGVTLEEAVALLAARAGKAPAKKTRAKKAPTKTSSQKKAKTAAGPNGEEQPAPKAKRKSKAKT
jgi:DNA topoisomerase-1